MAKMIRRGFKIQFQIACTLAMLAGGRGAIGQTVPTSQPGPQAAVAASQPDAQAGSVSFLITRNLPEHLSHERLAQIREAMAEHVPDRGIIDKPLADIEELVRRKQELDRMDPKVQDDYRRKAQLIDKVISSLSPTEQAALMRMPPAERAKRIRELIAAMNLRPADKPQQKP